MEASPQRSPALPPNPSPAAPPPVRKDSGSKNKVQRMGSNARGLFDDFTSWVELRLRLLQLDVQERVQGKIDEVIIKAAPVVVGLLAGFFALITVALFVGWALGHPAWGFLVVTGVLLLIAGALYARSRRLQRESREVEITASTSNGASGGGSQ